MRAWPIKQNGAALPSEFSRASSFQLQMAAGFNGRKKAQKGAKTSDKFLRFLRLFAADFVL